MSKLGSLYIQLGEPEGELAGCCETAEWAAGYIESLRQQLADSQKREVMLRTALEDFLKQYPHMAKGYLLDALAATEADLGGLILCEKEPVAEVDIADGFYWADICEDQIVKVGEKLYRAKEQGK